MCITNGLKTTGSIGLNGLATYSYSFGHGSPKTKKCKIQKGVILRPLLNLNMQMLKTSLIISKLLRSKGGNKEFLR